LPFNTFAKQFFWDNNGSFTGQLTHSNAGNRSYAYQDSSGTIPLLDFANNGNFKLGKAGNGYYV
jgi:hypothetical protein